MPDTQNKSNELMEREDWDEFWDGVNPVEYVRSLTYYDRLLLAFLSRQIRHSRPARVLELGCVYSKNLHHLPRSIDSVTQFYGLDTSLAPLNASACLFDSLRVSLTAGDFFAAPYKPGSFGLVASFGLIEHYLDPQTFLKCCLGLLEPGGILIAGYPSYQGLTGWLQRKVNLAALEHHFSLPSGKMAAEFERAGLIEVKSEYFGLFNPNMIGWGKGRLRRGLMFAFFAAARPVEWLSRLVRVTSLPGSLSSYIIASGRKPD
ncbi:MAG: class I SAM-dependent methyltransferase [Candidatus Glassbacteria bacterium]|nr:class I SAM-dependent methyltransferase [Candidatus Glassbacteria bacterium]